MEFWEDADLQAGGDYLSLAAQGDTISGTITGMRKRVWDDGKVAPELFLNTDAGTVIGGQQVAPENYSFTAGAYELKKELALQRPGVGDHFKATRGATEQLKGGRSIGHYTVEIVRGNAQQPPQQAQPPQQPVYRQAPPQAAQAPQYQQQPQQPVYQQAPQQQYQQPPQQAQHAQQPPQQGFEPPF